MKPDFDRDKLCELHNAGDDILAFNYAREYAYSNYANEIDRLVSLHNLIFSDRGIREVTDKRGLEDYEMDKRALLRMFGVTFSASGEMMPRDKLTEGQKAFFSASFVRDAMGFLLPVYHGTGTTIEAFDPDMTGKGHDQYGSGFYFTSSFTTALGYTTARQKACDGTDLPKLGGEDAPNVVEAYLNLKNPIVVNGVTSASLRGVSISVSDAEAILRKHPDIYRQYDDEIQNPLGDYIEEFWEGLHSRTMMNQYIHKLATRYFADTNMVLLEAFFCKYATEFREAVREVVGYDGVIVHFNESSHYIAWFPEQIKRVNNANPTTSKFMDK